MTLFWCVSCQTEYGCQQKEDTGHMSVMILVCRTSHGQMVNRRLQSIAAFLWLLIKQLITCIQCLALIS